MLSSPRRSPASDEMTARSAHLPSYRSIPLRPLTGAMPPWPLVLGSDAVTVGPFATNGEFLCSVKAVTAMTVTIAAMMATMAPLPHSPSGSLRFGIASPPLWGPGVPMLHSAQRTADSWRSGNPAHLARHSVGQRSYHEQDCKNAEQETSATPGALATWTNVVHGSAG
jgi:hypothetical protein